MLKPSLIKNLNLNLIDIKKQAKEAFFIFKVIVVVAAVLAWRLLPDLDPVCYCVYKSTGHIKDC